MKILLKFIIVSFKMRVPDIRGTHSNLAPAIYVQLWRLNPVPQVNKLYGNGVLLESKTYPNITGHESCHFLPIGDF